MPVLRQIITLLFATTLLLLPRPAGAQSELQLRGTLPIPVETEPQAAQLDTTQGQTWHRVSLRLSGSMCPACLLELQGKLKALAGVAYAKITPPPPSATDDPQPHRTAEGVIIYDKHANIWGLIEQCIKQEKFHSSNLSDDPVSAGKPDQ